MEAERTEYRTIARADEKGNLQVVSDQQIGPTQKFEFGAPDDNVTAAIGGGYVPNWKPDFLAGLGEDAFCSRFYFTKRFVIDIGDPSSKVTVKKRDLMIRHGFGYLCIPSNFSNDVASLQRLYKTALAEYHAYEKLHPRPPVYQEGAIVDEKGRVRIAKIRAMDVKVGGGIEGNVEMQAADLKAAKAVSKKDVKIMAKQAETIRLIRQAHEQNKPFRNPFVTKTQREYPVVYAEA